MFCKKVSVIVPVYNTEKYLEKCLNSLVSQTLEDIEIIVVNDGSPDNSQDIIDCFADKYPGKIITAGQENQGLGPARNTGVKHASCEYIGFADSDDWAEPDMFELLYKSAETEKSDAVICDYFLENEDGSGRQQAGIANDDDKTQDTVSNRVLTSTVSAVAWNKLYKKHLLEKFPFPASWYEDIATTPVILSHCNKISSVAKPLYHYIERAGGITSANENPKNADVLKSWDRCIAGSNKKYKEEIAYAVYYSICFFTNFRKKFSGEYINYFRDNQNYFENNKYIKKLISSGRLTDLFAISKTLNTDDNEENEISQYLSEFLEETEELIKNFGKLDSATLSELKEMYETAALAAKENTDKVSAQLSAELTRRLAMFSR